MELEFPEVVDGDDVRVSASTYVSFKQCPEQANSKLQGIYGPDSRPAFTGSLAHAVFSRHLSQGPIGDEEFVQACREEIGNSTLNLKLGSLGLKPSELSSVIEEVRGYYQRFVKLPVDGFRGAEVALDNEPLPGVRLVGKVDAVFLDELGGDRLVDWKTGEVGEPLDQLLFYSLLWALVKNRLPARVAAVSVKTGENFDAVPASSDVERVIAEVSALVSEIRLGWNKGVGLERRAGPWCRYCPVLEDCSEGKAAEALLG